MLIMFILAHMLVSCVQGEADEIKVKIKDHAKGKEEKIILYCRSGRRSAIAKKALEEIGYKNVLNAGAYEDLKKKEKKE